jgi:ADP-ribose pyrophosphatase YjhB (NUDIX family)
MSKHSTAVSRRAARAILIDENDHLVLIKRTKPGRDPYWTAPGGGVEIEDSSLESAMRRELAEELGADAGVAVQVFYCSDPDGDQVAVQYFFVTRLLKLDIESRTGTEFKDPSRGGYDLDRIDLRSDDLASVNLQPTVLRDFVLANRVALLAEVAD